MKITKLRIYLLIELILFISLFTFQIIYLSKGYVLSDKTKDLFIFIATIHVLLTFVSFLYSIYLLIINKNNERIREELFIFYFLFAFIGDIFFSYSKYEFVGHITFILSYLLFMYIRRARIFEYIGVILAGIISVTLLLIFNKLTFVMALDSFLASILILNMLMCIINYIKNKNNFDLILMIAEILVFISDASIGLSFIFNSNLVFVNILCLITWPTYVVACYLLNCYYTKKRLYK